MSNDSKQPPPDKEQIIANAIWFNFYGLILAGIGWYIYRREQHERSHLKEVKGVIVDSVKRRKDKTSTDYEYAPVIEFKNNGDPVRFSRASYESYTRSVGTEVIVRYDPQAPQTTAYMLDPWNGLLIWLPFAMAALVFAGGFNALWQLVRSRKG